MKKAIVKTISTLFPNTMVKVALNQLMNPQTKKLRENEIKVLDLAEKEIIDFKDFKIQTYQWKGGADTILLVHGWEGQAGNFSDLILRLIKENYTIISFDGPSHGFSSKGETSVFEFSELVGEMIQKFKVNKLISHSFGGVATTFALQNNPDIAIDKYLLLTTPDKFSERINDISEKVGITEKVKNKLIHKLENELNIDVQSMNVSDIANSLNVKKALIIHDKNDRVIPVAQSENINRNWDNCTLKVIEGTGHFRILRTDFVIEDVVEFMR